MSRLQSPKLKVLVHACVRMYSDEPKRVVYVDPFKVAIAAHDADVIFVTHPHGDHFSEKDIKKLSKPDTVLVRVEDCRAQAEAAGFSGDRFVSVAPGQKIEVRGLTAEAVPAYNVGKAFHTQSKGWVGYVINIDGKRVYVMGDTDDNEDVRAVQTDVLFVPIGGIYTMDMHEAAAYTNAVKPAKVVPLHYGALDDTRRSAEGFAELIDSDIEVRIDI